MKIAIHFTGNLDSKNYAFRWDGYLKEKGVEVLKCDLTDPENLNKLKTCSGVMWHWYHVFPDKFVAPKILNAIQFGLNIPVFPDIKTAWHFDDKIAQYFFLSLIDSPIAKSWFFINKKEASDFINSANFPLIFKLGVGAGSVNVFKLTNKEEAHQKLNEIFDKGIYPYSNYEYELGNKYSVGTNKFDMIKDLLLNKDITKHVNKETHWYYQIEKNYFYVQEFLAGNDFDVRVTVIGNRAFAFRRFNRENDFRASGSGKINYEINEIPTEAIKIAFEVSKRGEFQSMAYDFLFDSENKLKIIEISYSYVNKAVYDCEGYWDSDLNFHKGNFWPEECHVEDFLNKIKI